jgi:hypothetical protein
MKLGYLKTYNLKNQQFDIELLASLFLNLPLA